MTQLSPITPASSQAYLGNMSATVTSRAISQQGASSITPEKASCCTSLWNVLLAPFEFVGGIFASIGKFIMDYLCCCCCGSYADKIDYEKTKNLVEQICNCLDPSNTKKASDREKNYIHLWQKLDLGAKDELTHQLGLVAAAEHSTSKLENEADRTRYLEEHRAELKLDDLLQNYQSPLLLEAFNIYLNTVKAKLAN
jgi:hypothetical protein